MGGVAARDTSLERETRFFPRWDPLKISRLVAGAQHLRYTTVLGQIGHLCDPVLRDRQH
jgi:hypothetical protein